MFAALLAAEMLAAPASIAIGADSQHRNHSSRHRPIAQAQPQGQIACTEGGCQRIPAACTPVPGRTWRGMPTGYDVIVCPPR
jgi:hypothetical protein